MAALTTIAVTVPADAHHAPLRIAAARTVQSRKAVSLAGLAREALCEHFGVDLPDAPPSGRQRQKPTARIRTRPASQPTAG